MFRPRARDRNNDGGDGPEIIEDEESTVLPTPASYEGEYFLAMFCFSIKIFFRKVAFFANRFERHACCASCLTSFNVVSFERQISKSVMNRLKVLMKKFECCILRYGLLHGKILHLLLIFIDDVMDHFFMLMNCFAPVGLLYLFMIL